VRPQNQLPESYTEASTTIPLHVAVFGHSNQRETQHPWNTQYRVCVLLKNLGTQRSYLDLHLFYPNQLATHPHRTDFTRMTRIDTADTSLRRKAYQKLEVTPKYKAKLSRGDFRRFFYKATVNIKPRNSNRVLL
jgi:hypothetical protein